LQLFLIKDNFNSKVYDLRNKKTVLTERFNELNATLKCIHAELDTAQRKFLPDIPKFDEELEFPERVTEVGFTRFEALMVTKINTVIKGKKVVPVIKHYPMKIYGGVALAADWVGPIAGLLNMEKSEYLTVPGLELRPVSSPAHNQSLYRLSHSDLLIMCSS
jgi:hypothetical protein